MRSSGIPDEGVVQGLDSQVGPLTIFLRTLLYQMIVHVGEHRVVHLQKQARFINGAILLAERVRDCVNVIVLVRIILVDPVVGRAGRRYGGKKSFFHLHLAQCRFEIRSCPIDRGMVQVVDRPDTRLRDGPAGQPGKS